MTRLLCLAVMMIIVAQAAEAQIITPAVRLPAIPQLPLSSIDRTLATTEEQALQNVRRLQVRALVRHNSKVLEADGNGAAIIRGEILALSPTESMLEEARAAGFAVLRTRDLDGLPVHIVVLATPQGTSTRRALKQLRELAPSGSFDFNHIYNDSGAVSVASSALQTNPAGTMQEAAAPKRWKLGLIDSGIDTAHHVFKDVRIHQHGCDDKAIPDAHGTAVASLLVGHSPDFQGAAPGAELYAADVYCGLPTGGAADAVADAFAWLARERVPVINVSLVGPPNATLEAVVRALIARGHLIVAAVGNDGPAAPPLYPASYLGVVGVTAVDSHRHVLLEACRGSQVRFAAPGADMAAAKSTQEFVLVRGTSFAAPIVAGLLGRKLEEPDGTAAARALEELAREAVDLGSPGLDPIYGYGLVGADLAPDGRLASLHPR